MLDGHSEAGRTYMETVFAWSAGDLERRMPGGENGVEALARYDSVIAEAADSGAGTVAMVSHGAAIRMWVAARADNVDIDFAAARPLDNTGVVILEGSPADGWKVLTWEGAAVGPTGPGSEAGPAGRPLDEIE